MRVQVKIEGLEKLMAKISDPKLAKVPMTELLTEASILGQKEAVNAISGGTGVAGRSIGKKVYSRTLEARVYTRIAEPRAMSIEQGRKPGDVISFWSAAKWLKGTARKPAISREEGYTVRAIQDAIRSGGAKGKGYIMAAKESIEKEMPRLEKVALNKLEELAKK